ncbi:ABC transporter ATP-binding protein [Pseudomonas plecoglossicida]|uniref:ABC transporter ATP-binding protein n=1 Tax=Pseudomonas TaxID=286 RepID=UPI00076186A6|nr:MULTISPECIES: ABC transporter ATP-binding protein [Pseudomonas]MDN5520899.1 ABC transporter ATP-binding protein [Pseudomonas sp.]MDQ7966996.1 ABC transporter ATP-binding protein [Pseudomonas plecoglossicida]WBM45409.1 ABC transporter ATP-binding protein [Pseudomonas putida]WFG01764.1 ABC transporter ATP-binding protein [Pseudomonas putida]HDS0940198.1 ABC transporter ATP-binding protein [Pseudomonas putida]
MSSDLAITVSELSKCYHIYEKPHLRLQQMLFRGRKQFFTEFWALQEVNFELKKGESVGIIGRNGSGKSTLLQIICGTLNPTAGDIQVNGRVAALLELGAGFNPEFTGRENVYMAASLYGLTRSEIDERFQDIEAFADIGNFLDQPVKTYSSGMFVRLAFAVVAHVDADILVIDEALSVGDAFFTQKCMRFIRKFKEEKTLIFVSHDTSSIINLCDRAIWLNRGVQQKIGDAKSVCEHYLNDLFKNINEVAGEFDDPLSPRKESITRIGSPDGAWRDQRATIINASTLRNDIEVFKFQAPCDVTFGGEHAKITDVKLTDSLNNALSWVVGGEKVILKIEADAYIDLPRPILGFFVKDRLGQTLFGDNTFISYQQNPCSTAAGSKIIAQFEFYMPWLAKGDYTIQVAIADGDQHEHKQLHWIHDGLVVRSHHDPVSTGIIGIPLLSINLETVRPERG